MKNVLIILNYKDSYNVIKLLKKIVNYDAISHIVIVDNNSPDDSYFQLREYENEKITVIKSEKNGGYGFGNNVGIAYAVEHFTPKYITIVNPDISFENATLQTLLKYMDDNNMCGIVAPKCIENINYWGRMDCITTILSLLVVMRTLFKVVYFFTHRSRGPFEVGAVEGSFFCIRATMCKRGSLFDERLFLYGEENVICEKIRKTGHNCIVIPSVSYHHYHSQSIKKSIHSKTVIYRYKAESYFVYLKDYLNANEITILIMKFFIGIGKIERVTYDSVRTIVRKMRYEK